MKRVLTGIVTAVLVCVLMAPEVAAVAETWSYLNEGTGNGILVIRTEADSAAVARRTVRTMTEADAKDVTQAVRVVDMGMAPGTKVMHLYATVTMIGGNPMPGTTIFVADGTLVWVFITLGVDTDTDEMVTFVLDTVEAGEPTSLPTGFVFYKRGI